MSKLITRSQDMFQAFRHDPMHPLAALYVVSGLLAVLIPAIKYCREINYYHNSYEYQYNQQDEEDDRPRDIDINNCRWWQVWCESVWVNENGEYVNQEGDYNEYTPKWFSGWGKGGRSGDSRDGGAGSTAAVKFVYAWQLVLFVALLVYGTFVLERTARGVHSAMALQSLAILLFFWSNVSFLSMWMAANGSIKTEGREIEDNGGFFSQFSVLIFMTNFWYTIWGFSLAIFVACKARQSAQVEYQVNDSSDSYHDADDDVWIAPTNEGSVQVLKGDVGTTVEPRPNGTYFYR